MPFLSSLASFSGIVGKSVSERVKNWLESGKSTDREAELQLFFRQYAKVINYIHDRKNRLQEQIAEDKFGKLSE